MIMIKAIIVDDEQPAVDILKYFLVNNGKVEVVAEFNDPLAVMENFQNIKPDVAFLDMDMPGMDGLELGKRMLTLQKNIIIVFVTAFREYAVEAFDVQAVDYLLKPLLQEKVDRAIERMIAKHTKEMSTGIAIPSSKLLCLGNFAVHTTAGEYNVKWRTRKVEELFAYLLYYRNTAVDKSKIINALWYEGEWENADNKLHVALSLLKKNLREADLAIEIKFSAGCYCMEVGDGIRCDVDELKEFIDQDLVVNHDNVEKFVHVAALYRGDFFQDKIYQWCEPERMRLQKYYSNIIKKLAAYFLLKQEYQMAEDILNQGIGKLPLEEDLHELLLKTLFWLNNRIRMIKHYEYMERVIREQLGLDIRPDIKRLYEKLMNSQEDYEQVR